MNKVKNRKLVTLMVALLVSAMPLTVYAAEETELTVNYERPALPENAEGRKKPELTDEQKAAMLEKCKANLAEKLAAGEITQEKYDEAIAKIEAGEFVPKGLGMKGEKPKNAE